MTWFVDRSRTEADWTCPRLRYLAYEYDGRGLTSNPSNLKLTFGLAVHEALAALARGVPTPEIVAPLAAALHQAAEEAGADEIGCRETVALGTGLLLGFHRAIWPGLRERFPAIVAVEPEVVLPLPHFTWMARPDLLVRDRQGDIWYIEYKTTSTTKAHWIASWTYAIQVHATAVAAERALLDGEPVAGAIVIGLYKGSVRQGRRQSVFCYGYGESGIAPFTETRIVYDYRPGWRKIPSWEIDGGTSQWVAQMPIGLLQQQYAESPPIFIKRDLVERFLVQRAQREAEIQLNLDAIQAGMPEAIERLFPQSFSSCYRGWDDPCPMLRICFGQVDDPLEAGWVYRDPHHAAEHVDQQTQE